MKNEEPYYLFVYGTLRTGLNHPVIREIKDDVEWMGESFIKGKLFDIGNYPGAVKDIDVKNTEKKRRSIKGEVYLVKYPKKVFRILDEYEGFQEQFAAGSEYYREQELITLQNGKKIQAWVYWYNLPVEGKRRIRHADYLEYLKKKKRFAN